MKPEIKTEALTPAATVTKQADELILQHVLVCELVPAEQRKDPNVYECNVVVQTGRIDPDLFDGNLLAFWYDKIGCSTVDIATLKLMGEVVDIVVDDEGLLKPTDENGLLQGWVIIDDDGHERVLVGNLVFSGCDFEDGATIDCPLQRPQIQQLLDTGRIRPVGVNVL